MHIKLKTLYFGLSLYSGMLTTPTVASIPAELKQAYQLLLGKPLLPKGPTFERLNLAYNQRAEPGFWDEALKEEELLSVTGMRFAGSIVSVPTEPRPIFDDAMALILGILRDQRDAREIFTADYLYSGRAVIDPAPPSLQNNLKYEKLIDRQSLVRDLHHNGTPQWNLAAAHSKAGILTTRGWATRYYNMGTNRISVVAAIKGALCASIEEWKYPDLDDSWIRRDIDRSPGGNPQTFRRDCQKCHAPMDAMGGAFARFDYRQNTFVFESLIAKKINHNSDQFPTGRVTVDESWQILSPVFEAYGIHVGTSGQGVEEFAQLLVNSPQFSICMAQKAAKVICPKELSNERIKELAKEFVANGHNLKKLFVAVATGGCL